MLYTSHCIDITIKNHKHSHKNLTTVIAHELNLPIPIIVSNRKLNHQEQLNLIYSNDLQIFDIRCSLQLEVSTIDRPLIYEAIIIGQTCHGFSKI